MTRHALWNMSLILLTAGCSPTPKVEPNSVSQNAPAPSNLLRILYVEHPPRYEYRFLKNALLRDSSVLVHTYLMSADPGFPQEHSRHAKDPRFSQPLKAMPRTLEELLVYDVIIVGDVDAAQLPAEALTAFVEEHGRGLVVISGSMKTPGNWKGTPLAALLPVHASEPADEGEVPDRSLRYRLTPQGREDAVVTFSADMDREKSTELWEDRDGRGDGLAGIRWFAPSTARAGSETLVEVESAEGPWHPLFVKGRTGKGRVFFSATDETWLWRYLVGDEPWFYPFWRGAIGWAAGNS